MSLKKLNFLLPLLLTGCMVGPDYEKPDPVKGTDKWHDAEQNINVTESIAEYDWREFYSEPELQVLIDTALKNNINLLISAERVYRSQRSITSTDAALLPAIDYRAFSEREGESVGVEGDSAGIDTDAELHGLLKWEIDLWGQLRRASEAATAEWQASYADLYGARISLIGQVASLYYDIQDARKQLLITDGIIKDRQFSLDTNRLRHKQGTISGLNVTQSMVELLKEEVTIPTLKQELRRLNYQLALVLAESPQQFDIPDRAEVKVYASGIPAGLPSSLLTRRPDIIGAERKLQVASAEIGVAKGNFFPNISISGEYGRKSKALTDLLTYSAKNWLFRVDLLGPLIDWGVNRANLDQAKSEYRQALLEYRDVVFSALNDTAEAFDNYDKANDVYEIRIKLLNATEENLKISQLMYKNGVVDYLDVLDAQRNNANAQQALSSAVGSLQNARVRVYKSLGGGWDASAFTVRTDKKNRKEPVL